MAFATSSPGHIAPGLVFVSVLLCVALSLANGEYFDGAVRWCTVGQVEHAKCLRLNRTLVDQRVASNLGFQAFYVHCIQGVSVDDCVELVDRDSADVTSLDPGHMFTAGRYHNLVPIMQERYSGRETKHYYSVALVKKSSLLRHLSDFRGVRACFPCVGDLAGWVLPITQLISAGVMEVADCNNHVRSVSEFFGSSCAVGSLDTLYNPLGDNSNSLCQLCGSPTATASALIASNETSSNAAGQWCTASDIYVGQAGAVRCLVEAGDVAFVKHSIVVEMTQAAARNGTNVMWTARPQNGSSSGSSYIDARVDASQLELLCLDGRRAPLSDYAACHWGVVPSHVLVTASVKTDIERAKLQNYITAAVGALDRVRSETRFSLFESYQYGPRPNLIFQDATVSLSPLSKQQQLYTSYLADSMRPMLALYTCPVQHVRLCVASLPELEKCYRMREALQAQLLKPEIMCMWRRSHINCMREIHAGLADITVLDAGDVYTAGRYFGLVPIMTEAFDGDVTSFYAVVVVKRLDLDTDLLYLKNKMTCHTGVMHAAGWVLPLAYLVSNERVRGYGCDSLRTAANAFSKSCAPGALNPDYNDETPWHNMCYLCHGTSNHYCARNAEEDFYGHTGAFRCLVEGGGDVAFVKHTTVRENTGGARRQFWARNQLASDYELLCRDGTRAAVDRFAECNIGQVRSNAVVTRGGLQRNTTLINTVINLFLHAQQHFGLKSDSRFSFKMFHSPEPHADLIFSDVTQQLLALPVDQQNHRQYLGESFLQAKAIVDCHASAGVLSVSMTTLMTSLLARSLIGRCWM